MDKEKLRADTRRHYILSTVKSGFQKMLLDKEKKMLFLLIVLGYFFVSCFVTGNIEVYFKPLYFICFTVLFPVVIFTVLFFFGYVKHSKEFYENLVRIGFVNHAGEAPILINLYIDGRITVMTFRCKGCGYFAWNEHLEDIQNALNLTIASVKQGNDYNTVIVRAVEPNTTFGKVIPWRDSYINLEMESEFLLGKTIAGEDVTIDIDKMPMLLIGGSTGSGKTKLSMVIALQAIMRGAQMFICDLKGLDFLSLEKRDAKLVTTPSETLDVLTYIEQELYRRIEDYRKIGAVNYCEYVEKSGLYGNYRIFVLVDECSMLLDSGTTKESKQLSIDLTDKLATIARMGRAVGIHLIISTQRPDASGVPGSIKSNIDCRICGKADTTLSTIILGDGRANEAIPKDSQGRFIMANGLEDIIFQAFYYDNT